MQIAIIQFPGSNCERETMMAVKRAGMEPVEFLWNEPIAKLQHMHGFVIVGGFSYEDRSRAGIIAALDPVMQAIKAESEKGKPILGICNGAQVLVETGLVPGLENHKIGMALTENKRMAHGKILGTGYYNAWVNVRLADNHQRNAFTRHLSANAMLRVPIAHAQGRFVIPSALLDEMKIQGLVQWQYCDEDSKVDDHFPVNPNGSVDNIAAVSNKAGNVLAIMPHPERTKAGDVLFASMRDYIQDGNVIKTESLHFYPRRMVISPYQPQAKTVRFAVELMITDNQALTVQQTLRKCGIPVTVRRQTYWEIDCDDSKTLAAIKQTGVLYNDRKEVEVPLNDHRGQLSYLVRAKDDLIGQATKQALQDHYGITKAPAIRHGLLWHFSIDGANIDQVKEQILSTNIVCNPYAHDCYSFDT